MALKLTIVPSSPVLSHPWSLTCPGLSLGLICHSGLLSAVSISLIFSSWGLFDQQFWAARLLEMCLHLSSWAAASHSSKFQVHSTPLTRPQQIHPMYVSSVCVLIYHHIKMVFAGLWPDPSKLWKVDTCPGAKERLEHRKTPRWGHRSEVSCRSNGQLCAAQSLNSSKAQ